MNPHEAQRLAIELIDKHVIVDRQKWSFNWLVNCSNLGGCSFLNGYTVIQLNHRYTMLAQIEDVVDTIIHEIAHGLVGRGHGHDRTWKMKCIELGIRPRRGARSGDDAAREVRVERSNYVAECYECGAKYYAVKLGSRMRNGHLSCAKCARLHGFNDNNKLTYRRA